MKKFIITILTILGIHNGIAYSATEPNDDAARGVQSLWNASNERRDIFTAEGVDQSQARANANARTPDINNRIAKATVSDRKATRVETARILSAVVAGEFIAHANGTDAALCYDAAIAFNPTHKLYGHHTVLKLTQEIARSCMENYEFSMKFEFNDEEAAKLKELSSLIDFSIINFRSILNSTYYTHFTKTIEINDDTTECMMGRMLRGRGGIALGVTEEAAFEKKIIDIVELYDSSKRKEELLLEIPAFFEKQKVKGKYKGIDPIKALASEVDYFIAKINEFAKPNGGVVERHVVATSIADLKKAAATQPNLQDQVTQQGNKIKVWVELQSYGVKELRELVKKTRDKTLIDKLNYIITKYYDDLYGMLVPNERFRSVISQPIGYFTSVSYESSSQSSTSHHQSSSAFGFGYRFPF